MGKRHDADYAIQSTLSEILEGENYVVWPCIKLDPIAFKSILKVLKVFNLSYMTNAFQRLDGYN